MGQSSEWRVSNLFHYHVSYSHVERAMISGSRTLAISAHFFPSLDCCMAVMNSKCLGNALVHCEVDHNHNEGSSTVPTASALVPAGPAAVEKGDKGYELGPAGPVAVQGGDKDHDLLQSKCLGNALVHDGLMTSTATNDSPPPPTQP